MVIALFTLSLPVYAKEEPDNLHARSAVLMDADSGRVLFEKNGEEQLAMASTTKIMTCILALEKRQESNEIVTVSARAAAQPRVHLGMREGETYLLGDLFYSLMLESHNDTAVAIAEHISGSVEAFTKEMNAKAVEIGCKQAHFVTPNGLDATDEEGKHAITAADLARIMRYCIMDSPKKEEFLKITRTSSYHFSDREKKRTFSCSNHNAFLQMMEGALSGKTGFTGDAGYCYVGALRSKGRTFVVALLACGWPNHRQYKWEDTKKLMDYAIRTYEYQEIVPEMAVEDILVREGCRADTGLFETVRIPLKMKEKKIRILIGDGDRITYERHLRKSLMAPVKKGDPAGVVICRLNGEKIAKYEVVADENVGKKTQSWYLVRMIQRYTEFFVKKLS